MKFQAIQYPEQLGFTLTDGSGAEISNIFYVNNNWSKTTCVKFNPSLKPGDKPFKLIEKYTWPNCLESFLREQTTKEPIFWISQEQPQDKTSKLTMTLELEQGIGEYNCQWANGGAGEILRTEDESGTTLFKVNQVSAQLLPQASKKGLRLIRK